LFYDLFETTLGWVGTLASYDGLRRLSLRTSAEQALADLARGSIAAVHDPARFIAVRECLERYLTGDMTALAQIRLDIENGPPFFHEAWQACRKIPAGQTRSYAWLAKAAGRPKAVRAAGQAMARNRLVLIVPCHRVVGSDGCLHGYGGGLEIKARLLDLERRTVLQNI
jgi:O-6-methylguanine DNA methyltransferase